jgi:hypothetical protein
LDFKSWDHSTDQTLDLQLDVVTVTDVAHP